MSMTVQLVTLKDAASQLCVSVKTVRRLVDSGALPAVRVGGQLRIDADELAEYIFGEPS